MKGSGNEKQVKVRAAIRANNFALATLKHTHAGERCIERNVLPEDIMSAERKPMFCRQRPEDGRVEIVGRNIDGEVITVIAVWSDRDQCVIVTVMDWDIRRN